MANAQISARFGESKQDFVVTVTPQDTPLPAFEGTRMGLILKQVVDTTYNQQQFFGLYESAVDYVRSNNILNAIAAGDFAGKTHLCVSLERDGTTTMQATTGNAYTPLPDDSITLAIPVEAGWAREGSTVYLYGIAKRLYERFAEDFAKKV